MRNVAVSAVGSEQQDRSNSLGQDTRFGEVILRDQIAISTFDDDPQWEGLASVLGQDAEALLQKLKELHIAPEGITGSHSKCLPV